MSTDGESLRQTIAGLSADGYQRHALHGESSAWPEKNCYVDVWIELVHSLGLDPHAMLPVTVSLHFDGDQWTFLKPAHTDLFELYGVDVQEMNVWRTLHEHALDYLGEGRLISTEADAFWLPDTAGTDYQRKHTKSTIILAEIDPRAGTLGYFHNGGYFRLGGADYRATFRLDAEPSAEYMPLFAEVVHVDRVRRMSGRDLRERSARHLLREISRRPVGNPVIGFTDRLRAELPRLQERGLEYYHAWAFANFRQLGAMCDLAARYFEWLFADGAPERAELVQLHDEMSTLCKALVLKGARSVSSKKALDYSSFDTLINGWDTSLTLLRQYARRVSGAAGDGPLP